MEYILCIISGVFSAAGIWKKKKKEYHTLHDRKREYKQVNGSFMIFSCHLPSFKGSGIDPDLNTYVHMFNNNILTQWSQLGSDVMKFQSLLSASWYIYFGPILKIFLYSSWYRLRGGRVSVYSSFHPIDNETSDKDNDSATLLGGPSCIQCNKFKAAFRLTSKHLSFIKTCNTTYMIFARCSPTPSSVTLSQNKIEY